MGWEHLDSGNLPPSSGDCKSQMKVSAGLAFPEASLLGLQNGSLFLVSSVCACVLTSSYKDTSQIKLGLTLMISF